MIEIPKNEKIVINADLTPLLGLGINNHQLQETTIINRLNVFSNYVINCHLMNKDENLFNGNPSNVLGCFDIAGKPFERVTYSPKEGVFRKIKIINHITSMKIFVTDENGEKINFIGLPLKFKIEIL